MTFLTYGIWLPLWKTQNIYSLGSSLTDLKSYNIRKHIKFIDSIKYYQKPLSKLAKSTDNAGKKSIKSLFLDYLGLQHVHDSQFFLTELSEENRNLRDNILKFW